MKDPNQHEYLKENGKIGVMTMNTQPTMTKQEYASECDINNIMKKYVTTGEFNVAIKKGGVYGDFSEIQDYQGMLDTVRYAQDAFQILPAQVRLRFENDPGQLLSFLQDEKNYDEALKLGLVNPREPQTINDKSNDKPMNANAATPDPKPVP